MYKVLYCFYNALDGFYKVLHGFYKVSTGSPSARSRPDPQKSRIWISGPKPVQNQPGPNDNEVVHN